jgi:hypothetical protein
MATRRRPGGRTPALIGLAAWFVCYAAGRAAAADVELRPIKYDALADSVRALHGQVVLVVVWGEY